MAVVRDGREGGAVASGISALMLLALDGFRTGQWDQARQLADEGVELSETHGYRLSRWVGCHVQALLAAGRGDYDTTRALTDQMIQWAAPRRARRAGRQQPPGCSRKRSPFPAPTAGHSTSRGFSSPTVNGCGAPRPLPDRDFT